jgi:hypothetical protein
MQYFYCLKINYIKINSLFVSFTADAFLIVRSSIQDDFDQRPNILKQ